MKILESAIEEYMSSPVQVRNGTLCVDDPFASRTHQALSELLVKCPYQNGYEQSSMVDFLVHLGVAKPESDQKIVSSVRASFRGILEYCSIRLEPKLKNARSWKVLLRYVGRVFKEHAPLGNAYELAFEYEKYNFLIFLLMRWKLEFGRLKQLELNSSFKVSTSKEAKKLFQAANEFKSATSVVAPVTRSNTNSSVIGNTKVVDSVQPLDVLNGAVELYARSPLRSSNGTILISDPAASDTHSALSRLLAMHPTENGFKEQFMVDVLVELGFLRPQPHQIHCLITHVKNSFVNIIQACKAEVDGKTKHAKSWTFPLIIVGQVFEEHAPRGTTMELVTESDKYNFLIFLLMHWKLNYFGALPDYSTCYIMPNTEGKSPVNEPPKVYSIPVPTTNTSTHYYNTFGNTLTTTTASTLSNLGGYTVNGPTSNNSTPYQPNANILAMQPVLFSTPYATTTTNWGYGEKNTDHAITAGQNIGDGPPNTNISSQPNINTAQEQQQQYRSVRLPSGTIIYCDISRSKRFREHSQEIVNPTETQDAQTTQVDNTKELKRKNSSTIDEQSNKKRRVDGSEYVVALPTGNNSNSSVTGTTILAVSVQPLDVLKEAVELFALYPLRTVYGSAFIDFPYVSNTHNALSMLLVKFPRGNSIEMGSFDDFLVELGFPRPPYVNAIILSVKASFLDILQRCRLEVGEKYRNASSWDIPLKKVRNVFRMYAPVSTRTNLKTQEEQYNFLIFLLMHWKLKYGVLPDYNCSTSSNEETLLKHNQASINLPKERNLQAETVNVPPSNNNTNFPYGYTSLQQSYTAQANTTTNSNYSANEANYGAASMYAQPIINPVSISISEGQYYIPYFPASTTLRVNEKPILPNAYPWNAQQYSTTTTTMTSTNGEHSNSNNSTGSLIQEQNIRQELEEPDRERGFHEQIEIDFSNLLEYPEPDEASEEKVASYSY